MAETIKIEDIQSFEVKYLVYFMSETGFFNIFISVKHLA